ncbi:MAG: tRNA guanosine(34) transglycosylase Tgt [Oscillospiraceae bacterium]|nr:tRNA guanosine(34) transglycosylase Tgt [Oscillospiraceae bacterium]
MVTEINLPHGTVRLPAFFPDGTRGTVKSVDSFDLEGCGIGGIVANAYHLMSNPGQSAIKSLGGLNKFMNWNRPILTDSGGFQVFSLIGENPKFGEIREDRIVFRPENSGEKIILTPEKCVRAQFGYKSDIMMCLDYCTGPEAPAEINKKSVEVTVKWARRCKDEYENILKSKKIPLRPLIFAVIQGGGDKTLRKECASALIEIGFDGFGFGGWPLDRQNRLSCDILEYTAELMPGHLAKYAMGIGKPEEIAACCKMGYNLFDCVIPTREARHNRLYAFGEKYRSADEIDIESRDFYSYLYMEDDKYRRDSRPVSQVCDCLCCKRHSRAYLRHLAATGDPLACRLATIHNLRFYAMLMEIAAGAKAAKKY